MRSHALRFGILLLASYGMLYAAYKFYDPSIAGHADYFSYYKMHQAPLDFSATSAPFIYRQFTAITTNLIFAAGIYYPEDIAFTDARIDQRLFFAALLANYLGLVLAANIAGAITERESRHFTYSLLAGLFCLLSFFSLSVAVTGLSEGITWFFFAGLYFLYVRENRAAFASVLALSIFQREMVPVVFGLVATFSLLLRHGDRRYNGFVLALSVLCFLAYVLVRTYLIAVPGYELQLSLPYLIDNLLSPTATLRDTLFGGFLSQNLMLISIAIAAALWRRTGAIPKELFVLVLTFLAVVVIVLAEDIGGGTGRISSMLSPAFAAFAATSFYRYELSRTARHAPEQA